MIVTAEVHQLHKNFEIFGNRFLILHLSSILCFLFFLQTVGDKSANVGEQWVLNFTQFTLEHCLFCIEQNFNELFGRRKKGWEIQGK